LQESPAKRKPEIEIAIRWQTVLDTASAALFAGAAVWYFATPEIVERPLRPLAYDRDGNIYASLQCVTERNTAHLFTHSRVEPELKDSVELVEWNDLYRFAQETRTGAARRIHLARARSALHRVRRIRRTRSALGLFLRNEREKPRTRPGIIRLRHFARWRPSCRNAPA